MQASIRNRLITEPFELFFEMKHTALEIYTLCAAANAGCWLEFLSSGLFPLLRKLLLSVLHIQLRVAICEFLLLALDRLGLDSIRVLGRGLECGLCVTNSLSLIELIRLLRNLISPRSIARNLAARPDIHHTV